MQDKELSRLIEKIANKRYSAADYASKLLSKMKKSGKRFSNRTWYLLGMELYACGRFDNALEAMHRAIEEGERLQDKDYLAETYKDLAVIYEKGNGHNYEAAFSMAERAYSIRRKAHGNNDIITRVYKDRIRRYSYFKAFKKDEDLWEEFLSPVQPVKLTIWQACYDSLISAYSYLYEIINAKFPIILNLSNDKVSSIVKKITDKRLSAMDDACKLLMKMLSSKEDFPDYAWSAIGLELYLSRRLDDAIKAMVKAAHEGEKLRGDERDNLAVIYEDLSMMYEEGFDHDYEAAFESARKAYDIRKEIHGEDNILTRLAKERVRKYEYLKEFKKDEQLEKDFNDWVEGGGKSPETI